AWTAQLKALKTVTEPLRALRSAASRRPDEAGAALALGRALLERGLRDEGEALLQLVTIRWPASDSSAEALWCLGRFYHRVRREPVIAQHIWRELGERHARSPWAGGAWWWYARAQVALGRPEVGAAALEAVARRPMPGAGALRMYGSFLKKHALTARYPGARQLIRATLAEGKGSLPVTDREALEALEAELH
ncbi:MAG: hypothetical protein QF464_15060, partial [Myxococcota bacterium]|nr:hypothetical protein [Myxococcota bacterium]